MGFGFRKRIKIMPGVHVNLSKRGVSTSLGGRGATVNLGGKRGPTLTTGIPGTGLTHTTSLGRKKSRRTHSVDDSHAAPSHSRTRGPSEAAFVSFAYMTILASIVLCALVAWLAPAEWSPILFLAAVVVSMIAGAVAARGTYMSRMGR